MNAIRLIVALVLLAAVLAVTYWYGSGRLRGRNTQGTTSAAERRQRRAEQRKTEPFGAGLPATLLSPTVEPVDDTAAESPEGDKSD
jgi:hypothetical protein